MSRGSARLPTSTSPHEKAPGRSDSRSDSSPGYVTGGRTHFHDDRDRADQTHMLNFPASRSFEDTPFIPPLESTSHDNIRRDLPQLVCHPHVRFSDTFSVLEPA